MTARDIGMATQVMAQFISLCVPEGTLSAEAVANTPRRYTEAFLELMGYDDEDWAFTTFESPCDEMVIVKDIECTSMCEHHLLPFTGKAHVGYIPQGQLAGLSKLARTVKHLCRGVWTQEPLTVSIASYLMEQLKPLGVAVIMEMSHSCMVIRGVSANGSKTITSAMTGVFLDRTNNARAEFLSLIK